MLILFGLCTALATLLGWLLALRQRDHLHLLLGFSAGAVIGVAFFDLMPEAFDLAQLKFTPQTVATIIGVGFLLFMLLSRLLSQNSEESAASNRVAVSGLVMHSVLDGLGIGLAFHVSTAIGVIVLAGVVAHDFSDGLNTVAISESQSTRREATQWLIADAIAPMIGIWIASFIAVSQPYLGIILAIFSGFFTYIGASDLIPESQHRHPQVATSLMTILGATVIFIAVHLATL